MDPGSLHPALQWRRSVENIGGQKASWLGRGRVQEGRSLPATDVRVITLPEIFWSDPAFRFVLGKKILNAGPKH